MEITNNDIDIIITRINHLYPDLKISAVTLEDKEYIIEIEHDTNMLGSGSTQRWTVEEGKAVFKGAFSK
ncbi:MAG TPA: hypothetical protein VGO09_07540 [Flavisolibacter sp.]|jgi:hypothetical protein|nr:hypothetical protein [Flavisolibacter sp.]